MGWSDLEDYAPEPNAKGLRLQSRNQIRHCSLKRPSDLKLGLFVVARQFGPDVDIRVGADDLVVVDDLVRAVERSTVARRHVTDRSRLSVGVEAGLLIDAGAGVGLAIGRRHLSADRLQRLHSSDSGP